MNAIKKSVSSELEDYFKNIVTISAVCSETVINKKKKQQSVWLQTKLKRLDFKFQWRK